MSKSQGAAGGWAHGTETAGKAGDMRTPGQAILKPSRWSWGGGGGWVQKLEFQALSQLGSTLDGHQADLLLHLGIHSERGTAPPPREHTFTKGGLLCISYERSGETGSVRCLGSESQTTPAVWDGAHIPAVPQASHMAPGAQEALAKQPALLTCEKEPLQSLQGFFWVFC